MEALRSSSTLELVTSILESLLLSMGFVIKFGPNHHIDKLKARLVTKTCTQIFDLDYSDILSSP